MQLVLQVVVASALLLLQVGDESAWHSKDRSIRVREMSRTPDRSTFTAEIDDSTTGKTWSVTFSNATLTVSSAVMFKEQGRLVVLGKSSSAQMITILDPKLGKPIDTFYTLNAAISPTGRWVIYEHYRRNQEPDYGTMYAVYDVALSPAANRVATQIDATIGAGVPIYPHTQRQTRRWDALSDDNKHVSMSPIVWLSETVAAVVDRSEMEAQLVTFSMSPGVTGPIIKAVPFDLAKLINYDTVPAGENAARFLITESITSSADDPNVVIVKFARLPELRVRSARIQVW